MGARHYNSAGTYPNIILFLQATFYICYVFLSKPIHMLRSLLLLSIFLLASISVSAQDTLYKTNHEKVIVKVQQVGPNEIIYKRYNAPDGPVYLISPSEVIKIVYIDGHVDLFTDEDGNVNGEAKELFPFHSWNVGFNSFDMMLGLVSVYGEYNSIKDGLSFKIPLSCGIAAMAGSDPSSGYGNPEYYYYTKDKIFSTGIDMRYFPAKQCHVANYYLGMSFEFGMVNYKSYSYDPWYPYYENKTKISSYAGIGVTNGVSLRASEHISIGIDITMGMMVTSLESQSDYHPMGRFGINMGYRFGK